MLRPFPWPCPWQVGETAWLFYGRKPLVSDQHDPLIARVGPIYTLIQNKYYVDELYWKGVIRRSFRLRHGLPHCGSGRDRWFFKYTGAYSNPTRKVSQGVVQIIINGTGNQVGRTTEALGRSCARSRPAPSGLFNHHGAVRLGIAILMFYFIQ